MKTVLITIAEKPAPNYPLCVVVVDEDGKRSQETLVRNVREARIFGNGVCTGARLCHDNNTFPANVTIDPILIDDCK